MCGCAGTPGGGRSPPLRREPRAAVACFSRLARRSGGPSGAVPKSPSTLEAPTSVHEESADAEADVPALVIAWSAEEPQRIGEAALFEMEGSARILGRGGVDAGSRRVVFGRRRPGERGVAREAQGAGISREQLRITRKGRQLAVERIGKCPVLFRGAKVDQCVVAPGDTLLLKGQLLLLFVLRPAQTPLLRNYPPALLGPFGEPCEMGLLGESTAMWRLRDEVAFHARAGAHALILGPSGAGKELVARAIHRLSPRSKGPFVARNAATLPVGIAEAELFGNVKNYPNPGMPERPGLVGAAEGGTLFLDEMGDLPEALHASLLRVLDGDGEYHRLGEHRARRADLRVVGATNRPPESLKHDLLARLPLRVRVHGLTERRDDIPLLVRHLLRRARDKAPDLVSRFAGPDGEVGVTSELLEHLVQRSYTTHIRELDGLLWHAMAKSRGSRVELPDDMPAEALPEAQTSARLQAETPAAALPGERAPVRVLRRRPGEEPTAEEIKAAVTENGGNLVQAAKALGLVSRYALYRLLRRYGIDADALRPTGD